MNPIAKQKARKYAVQALYQWHKTQQSVIDVERQFLNRDIRDPQKVDVEYFLVLLHGVPKNLDDIDSALQPHLGERTVADVDPIELSVLRVAAHELLFNADVPYRVVINEAVDITKTFGAEDGFKFVNAVLDKAAQTLRGDEQTS